MAAGYAALEFTKRGISHGELCIISEEPVSFFLPFFSFCFHGIQFLRAKQFMSLMGIYMLFTIGLLLFRTFNSVFEYKNKNTNINSYTFQIPFYEISVKLMEEKPRA